MVERYHINKSRMLNSRLEMREMDMRQDQEWKL